jgi:hypothetical protein
MADTKDIVLRINAITDKEVMEEYGEVLDKVLGSYDDNIRTLQSYRDLVKSLRADISAYNKVIAEQGDLTEEQAADYEELIKMERRYSNEISKLQIVLKNQEKINQSLEGSMENQSLLLGKLRMAWRKMTDEQKAANPQMLAAIQALDRHMKGADATIGNFQRNVGNYPGLMAQMGQSVANMAASVNPAFGSVTQVVMGMGEQFGLTSGAIGTLGGVIGVAAVGFKAFQDAMELTQTVGDAVEIKVAGWQATYDKFIRTVVSADFSNFIQGLRDAKNIGEETAAVLDELFERNNALTIAEAKASVEQQRNLKIMRDQTRSVEERKAAGEAYTASVMELAQRRQDIAKQEHEALLKNFAAQTGASEEQISWYIENYDTYRVAVNKHLDDVARAEEAYKAQQKYIRQLEGAATTQDYAEAQELYNKWQAAKESVSNLSEEEQRFLAIQNKYNLANDEMTTQLVNSWANVYRAIAGAESATQRAATTVNSLTAQQQRREGKASSKKGVEIDASKVFTFKEDKSKVKIATQNLFSAFEEEIDKELAGVQAMRGGGTSPLAVALGVTDEQLTSIKSQAMQAAQQIYGSIQQAAQQASQRRLNDELKAVETEAEQEKAILKAKLDSGVINEKQYEKKIAEIDKQAEAKREEMQKEAFEREKRWNIATALMNMALAITNIWATNKGGAAARIAETVIATASGLAQIAAISAQKYARGGELHGASHAQGGIKGNIQGHNIELEGDEVVINKRSSRKYRSLLSYINSDNGWGVDFAGVRGRGGYHPQLKYARGGVLGSYDFSPASVPQASLLQKQMERQVEQTESLIAATNRRIDRLQVQVNISDIEGASNTKRVHINRAKL